MKKLGSMGLVILLLVSVGCGNGAENKNQPVIAPVVVPIEEQEEIYKLTADDFKVFFNKYFSLSEEDLLALNQNPSDIESEYWTNHSHYKTKILGIMGNYLGEEEKTKLSSSYLQDEIDLPKKVLINNYVTYGPATVEEIEITSTRPLGTDTIYELAVTTVNKVQEVEHFIRDYDWDEQKGYYVKRSEGTGTGSLYKLLGAYIEGQVEANYMYAKQVDEDIPDEIKLLQHYWVEVKEGEALQIRSIKEAAALTADPSQKQLVTNTQYITRVPYYEAASEKEEALLHKVFEKLMGVSKGQYTYYDKAYDTNIEVFTQMWKDLGLADTVSIEADSYLQAYAKTLNPYKDNIASIELNKEGINIKPSVYGTKKQPRFIVSLPIKTLLSNNQIVYYKYKYFIGMDAEKIEFIQFMNMEEMTEEAYLALGVVETAVTVQ